MARRRLEMSIFFIKPSTTFGKANEAKRLMQVGGFHALMLCFCCQPLTTTKTGAYQCFEQKDGIMQRSTQKILF
jgi:hypothetical protein